MCQAKNQGGKRCQCDNIDQRRLRRKAKILIDNEHKPVRFHSLNEDSIIPYSELKATASQIRSRIQSEELSDEQKEQEITQFGYSVLYHSEKLTHETNQEDKQELEEIDTQIQKIKNQLKSPMPNKQGLKDKLEVLEEKRSLIEQKDEKRRILTVLNDIRHFGGEIEFSKNSNPEMADFYNKEISQYYPQEWLEKSNQHNQKLNLQSYKLNELGGMAGVYFHNNITNDKTDFSNNVDRSQTQSLTGDSESLQNIRKYLDGEGSLESVQDILKSDGSTTKLAIFKIRKFKPKDEKVDEQEYILSGGSESIVHHFNQIKGQNMSSQELREFAENNPVWIAKEDKTYYNVEGNLFVASDLPEVEKKSVAVHELGHRMESISESRMLPRIEKSFLLRRSNTDVLYKEVKSVGGYDQNIGVCYNTDITTTEYASKTYLNDKSEEVFTVGMENIFGIRKSGDRKKPDRDYKSFMLGTLSVL